MDNNEKIDIAERRKEIKNNIFSPKFITKTIQIKTGEVFEIISEKKKVIIEAQDDSFRLYTIKGNIRESVVV